MFARAEEAANGQDNIDLSRLVQADIVDVAETSSVTYPNSADVGSGTRHGKGFPERWAISRNAALCLA